CSHETFSTKRKVSKEEGETLAKIFGVLHKEVDSRNPESAQEALGRITFCIYKKVLRDVLGNGPNQGVRPVIQSPPSGRQANSCANSTDPPANSFLGGNGEEVAVLESQLSAVRREAERLKAKETTLRQQEQLLHRENSELTQHLASAKREIQTLNSEKTALQREQHSLKQQLTQRENEVWRLNGEISSLQQSLRQLGSQCFSLEQEKLGLSRALESQTQESADVQWRLQQQLTLKEEALGNEVRDHSETRAALRHAQLAVDEAREENRRLRESQRPAEVDDHWRVSRDEVVILNEGMLGTGAWGYVAKGEFRGKRVAVKCLHMEIVASQTLQRVHREIHTMASIRHPNIVLFVAAVLDSEGQPLIVSELLDTNLRSAYQNHQLNGTGTKVEILHGVSCALNYLHKLREPIIHRDVSSPNVLLRAARNDKWTPKLSDFGSANLARCSQTLGEGAIIYSAPETFPPSLQSPKSLPQTTKIDVYSFGVLMGELLTEQLPNPTTLHLTVETVGAEWPDLHTLIVSCTKPDPLLRPDMDTVISTYLSPLLI
ncbi:Probable serine/threonine-protein kinase DDB_G0271682, partial [Geodia barretti]